MRTSDWSLVIFTVLVQAAVGGFILTGIASNYFFKTDNANVHQLSSKLLIVICSLLISALTISFIHLGSPKNAIYALRNISSSWLSREILFVGLFAFMVCGFTIIHIKENLAAEYSTIFVLMISFIGLASVFSMSKIYMLETVPAWNNISTPLQFFLSTLILGTVFFVAGLFIIAEQQNITQLEIMPLEKIVRWLILILTIIVILQLSSWLVHIASLSNSGLAGKISYTLVIKKYAAFFYARIILALSAVIIFICLLLNINKNITDPKLLLITLSILTISELLGRLLFYTMFERVGV